jgi:hypothetical protein
MNRDDMVAPPLVVGQVVLLGPRPADVPVLGPRRPLIRHPGFPRKSRKIDHSMTSDSTRIPLRRSWPVGSIA